MSNYSFKIKVSEKVLTILERGTHTPEKLLRQKIQCQGKNNNKTKTQFACLDNVFYWFQRFLFQIYIYKKRLLMTCTTCDKGSWVQPALYWGFTSKRAGKWHQTLSLCDGDVAGCQDEAWSQSVCLLQMTAACWIWLHTHWSDRGRDASLDSAAWCPAESLNPAQLTHRKGRLFYHTLWCILKKRFTNPLTRFYFILFKFNLFSYYLKL